MTAALLLEQLFNGFQAGVTLFLVAAGLTLILGIMDFVFLAHGSQVMIGAYAATLLSAITDSFMMGILLALPITFLCGYVLEYLVVRYLYQRDHLEQVLATFGLIMIFNEAVRISFGSAAIFSELPSAFSGFVYILPDTPYPAYRLLVIVVGLLLALLISVFVTHTRMGAKLRAGAYNQQMTAALGVNIQLLRRVVFAIGATLAGIAGMMLGPLTAVEPGMGEPLLILSLVVIIIGGIGSIKGAFIAALLVGMVDTMGRVLLPIVLRQIIEQSAADGAGAALASMMVYILMAGVLIFRPAGLFPPKGKR